MLDYDGTIVDARTRTLPPAEEIMRALIRLREGFALAIATGRGKSVRKSLREAVAEALWPRVTVGYYNGLDIAPLSDDDTPNGSARPSRALAAVASRLRAQPEVAFCAQQTDRAHQITLEPRHALREDHLWLLAQQAILSEGVSGVHVVRSSHSIDIIDAKRAKGAVVDAMRENVRDGAILCVGDRGRWPGNDHELLAEPFSLSVDEVSLDPATCWHLGPAKDRAARRHCSAIWKGSSCVTADLFGNEPALAHAPRPAHVGGVSLLQNRSRWDKVRCLVSPWNFPSRLGRPSCRKRLT